MGEEEAEIDLKSNNLDKKYRRKPPGFQPNLWVFIRPAIAAFGRSDLPRIEIARGSTGQ
jgi:hypothetical protein